MRCTRCETEFADSATICPQCGTPTHQGIATTFSYLPPDTPPWPTSIPQRASQQPPQPIQTALPTRSSKGGVRTLLIALAIIILTPLIGAGITLLSLYSQGQLSSASASHAHVTAPQAQSQATPAATPTAQSSAQQNTLPTPPSFKKTSSADLNVSLQYPSNWQLGNVQKDTDGNNSITIQSTQYVPMVFQVYRFSSTTTAQFGSADTVDQAALANIQQNLQGTSATQAAASTNSQPTIGGVQWTQEEVVLADSSGTKYHVVVSSVLHNKVYYAIIASAPDTYYTDALQKYIQPMYNSFQFLS
jgi:hypothetical protein